MDRERPPRPTWKTLRNGGMALLAGGAVGMLISWLIHRQVAWDSLGLILATIGGIFLVASLASWLISRHREGR